MNITPVEIINNRNKNILEKKFDKKTYYKEIRTYEPKIDKNLLPQDYGYHPNIITRNATLKSVPQCEYGQIQDSKGRIFNRHTTFFARGDLDWFDLGEYLKSKYKSIEDVDIQCFGCSTGQEAYTLAVLLKHVYGDEPFIIHASDIDENIIKLDINRQKSGIYLKSFECEDLLENLGIDKDEEESNDDYLGRFFILHDNLGQIRPEIINTVEFSKKNILTSTGTLSKTKPSIVLCRNMWPYIDPELYYDFAEKLYNSLPEDSIVVLGIFDCNGEYGRKHSSDFPNALVEAGFKPNYRAAGVLCYIGGRNNKKLIYEK